MDGTENIFKPAKAAHNFKDDIMNVDIKRIFQKE